MPEFNEERYSRNVGLLGAEGQRRLEAITVGIVGVGGLGSHVVQQLAYLGTRRFVLVDFDIVEASNLNRLVGAGPSDVGRLKVDVASQVIHGILPDATVSTQSEPAQSIDALRILADADCIIGCVDNDSARLRLTETASNQRIPYFDLASDSGDTGGLTWFGGRVFAAVGGTRCLSCAGEFDQRELALAAMDDRQRKVDERIYGVSRQDLQGFGPMVVSINGVVASLGVTEFVAWAAQLRPPKAHLVYRGDLGTVTVRNDERDGSCYYCDRWQVGVNPCDDGEPV